MSKLWQLKKISTGESLNEPQVLPQNWGPIFGLSGITDKLSDLSWLGDDYKDMGWFIVGDAPAGPTTSTQDELVWNLAKQLLADSDWAVLPDVPMTSGEKASWMDYRKALREIKLQPGFPNDVTWPSKPV